MAFLKFSGIGIRGISATVPKQIINNYDYTMHFPKEDVKEIVDKIGIFERRFVDENTCSSDLCFNAANELLNDLEIDRSEIDLLVFVSQTADYRMPATSIILQNKLGLNKSTMAFDINLGCSGFVYGLSTVYSIMQQPGFKKALLLDGETRSRIYSPKDRKTAFLFGDGGIAALIEKSEEYGDSFFNLGSDGSKESLIKVNAGGYRNPSSAETLKENIVDEYGNIRSEEHGYMNGADVFNFVLQEIPKNLKQLFAFANKQTDEMNYYLFHQANSYMNEYLRNKLKLDPEKVPTSIEKFGNTSSVSIPLTMVAKLQNKLEGKNQILLSGFGVGMSWASAILQTNNCYLGDITEI